MLRWSATCLAVAVALIAAARTETGSRLAAAPVAELAAGLDQAGLALLGMTSARRAHLATIERLADFRADEPMRALARHVGMLWISFTESDGARKTYQCTATLIARDKILSNHHCLERSKSATNLSLELWLDHVTGAAESYGIETVPLEQSAPLDYVILRIAPADQSRVPSRGPHFRFRAALPGERLIIIHHSDGAPLQITRAGCRAEALPPSHDTELLHSCATRPGSSGALLLAERDNAVVGLHHSIRRHRDRAPGAATSAPALLGNSPILRAITQSLVTATPR